MTTPNTPNAAERPSDGYPIVTEAMVSRFLGWKLPASFSPDNHIVFDRKGVKHLSHWPTGTNLLTATEARAMLEYVLTDMSPQAQLQRVLHEAFREDRPAESVSAEPVADRPEVECRYFFFPNPNVEGHQIELEWGFEYEAKGVHEKYFHPLHESDYLHPQPSTPGAVSDEDARRAMEAYRDAFKNFHRSLCARFGYTHDKLFWWRDLVSLEEHIAKLAAPPAQAVSDEWSPTIDDMPEVICVAKRIHVERSRHMDNWFVGFGKDESCQIEGTANHWYWLAYALLGLVDEKDSPYSEDKPLPFSPAYIRAALESFAKRSAAAKERDTTTVFLADVEAELRHARAKFPGDRIMTIALAEEFGELAKAVLDEPSAHVYKEAVQTAVMAARVVIDGDSSVNEWRAAKGLDGLTDASRSAAK